MFLYENILCRNLVLILRLLIYRDSGSRWRDKRNIYIYMYEKAVFLFSQFRCLHKEWSCGRVCIHRLGFCWKVLGIKLFATLTWLVKRFIYCFHWKKNVKKKKKKRENINMNSIKENKFSSVAPVSDGSLTVPVQTQLYIVSMLSEIFCILLCLKNVLLKDHSRLQIIFTVILVKKWVHMEGIMSLFTPIFC